MAPIGSPIRFNVLMLLILRIEVTILILNLHLRLRDIKKIELDTLLFEKYLILELE